MAKMSLSPFDRGRQIATAKAAGITQLATNAQALAASRADRAISAANLTSMKASDAEALAKTSSSVFLTPSNLAGAGFLQFADVTLTAAEVKALATTPIELVAAPAAGSALMFRGALLKLVYGSEVFTESGDNVGIKYTNASGVQVCTTVECTGFITASADTYTNAVPVADAIVAASAAEAKALVLDNLGSNFAGNASNDSTLIVRTFYEVVTLV